MTAKALDSEAVEHDEDFGKLRIPNELKKFLIKMPGGTKKYLPAAWRLLWFRDKYPFHGIETEIVEFNPADGWVIFKATVKDEKGRILSTGHGYETAAGFPGGYIEKAETNAAARALGLLGFAPNADESLLGDTVEGAKPADSGVAVPPARNGVVAGSIWAGPGQCPSCHALPEKKHGSKCTA